MKFATINVLKLLATALILHEAAAGTKSGIPGYTIVKQEEASCGHDLPRRRQTVSYLENYGWVYVKFGNLMGWYCSECFQKKMYPRGATVAAVQTAITAFGISDCSKTLRQRYGIEQDTMSSQWLDGTKVRIIAGPEAGNSGSVIHDDGGRGYVLVMPKGKQDPLHLRKVQLQVIIEPLSRSRAGSSGSTTATRPRGTPISSTPKVLRDVSSNKTDCGLSRDSVSIVRPRNNTSLSSLSRGPSDSVLSRRSTEVSESDGRSRSNGMEVFYTERRNTPTAVTRRRLLERLQGF